MKEYMIATSLIATTLLELVEKLSGGIKKQIELSTYVHSLQILVKQKFANKICVKVTAKRLQSISKGT